MQVNGFLNHVDGRSGLSINHDGVALEQNRVHQVVHILLALNDGLGDNLTRLGPEAVEIGVP